MLPVVMKQMLVYLRGEYETKQPSCFDRLLPEFFESVQPINVSNSELPIDIYCPISQLHIFYLENNQDQLLQLLNAINDGSSMTRQLTAQEAHDLGEFVIICRIGRDNLLCGLRVFRDRESFNEVVRSGTIREVKVVHKKNSA